DYAALLGLLSFTGNMVLRIFFTADPIKIKGGDSSGCSYLSGVILALMLSMTLLGITGCAAGKANSSITTLRATHATARQAAIAVKTMCEKGLLKGDDCANAEKAWEAYRDSEKAAKEIMIGAVKAGRDLDTDTDVNGALMSFSSASLDIFELAIRVGAITGPGGN
ncbi:MAG TPA: hypothetical protein VGK71_01195, partial [Nitrospirota bacterium]